MSSASFATALRGSSDSLACEAARVRPRGSRDELAMLSCQHSALQVSITHGGALPADDTRTAYTHDCTVLADSSHGDSHVGSVSPAATRTRTLALTLTLTRTRTLTLALTRTRTLALNRTRTRTLALALTLTLAPPPLHRLLRLTTRRLRLHLHHEQLRCRMYRQRSSSAYRCT